MQTAHLIFARHIRIFVMTHTLRTTLSASLMRNIILIEAIRIFNLKNFRRI